MSFNISIQSLNNVFSVAVMEDKKKKSIVLLSKNICLQASGKTSHIKWIHFEVTEEVTYKHFLRQYFFSSLKKRKYPVTGSSLVENAVMMPEVRMLQADRRPTVI